MSTSLRNHYRASERRALKLASLQARTRDRTTNLSFKGTQYRVIRFTDGTYGIMRGSRWILYSNNVTCELKRRARIVFAQADAVDVFSC